MVVLRISNYFIVLSNNRCILLMFTTFLLSIVTYLSAYEASRNIHTYNLQEKTKYNIKTENDDSIFGFHPEVEIKDGVCSKGESPWNHRWIKSELVKFLQVYNQRPGDNRLGTPMMHQFAMWCIVRHLQPRHIIESGVWRGLGTWIFRQAAPEAQLILLDPQLRKDKIYIDNHNDTLYFTDRNFRDFSTMRYWKDVKLDVDRTLAFIDDHNTPFKRIPHARRVGIKHMIFEDNYWLGFYDCLSLKQGCSCILGHPECKTFKYKDSYGSVKRNLTENHLKIISQTFQEIETYKEFPMMWDVYRTGFDKISKESTNFLYGTKDGRKLLEELGLKWFPFNSQLDGSYTYANIAYIKLKY